jgi:hypothetical protein
MGRAFLPLALLALLIAGCTPTAIDPRVPLKIEPVMKSVQTDEGTYELRLASRTLAPLSGQGPKVRLVAAIHIADREYYRQVQRILDKDTVTLFEGVSNKKDDFKKQGPSRRPDALYTKIADALGLISQYEGIDYRREHFHNADLTQGEMLARLRGETLTTPKPEGPDQVLGAPAKQAEAKYKALTEVMQGGGLMGAMANIGLAVIKHNPRLRATMLLGIIGTDPTASEQAMAKQLGGESGKRIARLIVEERNQEALSGLRRFIGQRKTGETVALFYGAAHLEGIEDALVRRFGYVPESTEWLVAVKVDPEEAGLTPQQAKEALKMTRK